MQISNNYIVVEKLEEPQQEGFKTVEVQDDYVYKGKVTHVPEAPVYMGNKPVTIGDTVLFAKYSPDTHEVDIDINEPHKDGSITVKGSKKVKFVAISDLLAVI